MKVFNFNILAISHNLASMTVERKTSVIANDFREAKRRLRSCRVQIVKYNGATKIKKPNLYGYEPGKKY